MTKPTEFTSKTAAEICERLASGESLRAICRGDDMPEITRVYRWLRKDEEFAQQYAHARADQADTYADQVMDIADDSTLSAEDRRIMIDARKWTAGKLKPGRWGDKLEVGGSLTVTLEDDSAKL